MNASRDPRGRAPFVAPALFASLLAVTVSAGCSKHVSEVVGPSRDVSRAAALASAEFIADPVEVDAPSLDHHKSPRLRVWTDDWKGVTDQGVSLDPSHIHDLVVPAGQPITFRWAVRPAAHLAGTRWAVDLEDITDETPRSGTDDITHWSAWSETEASATVGFAAGSGVHFLYVEARDDLGFFTLVTVRVLTDDGSGLVSTRR